MSVVYSRRVNTELPFTQVEGRTREKDIDHIESIDNLHLVVSVSRPQH
jgi:hypothetical protein